MEEINQNNNGEVYYDWDFAKDPEPGDFCELIGSPHAKDKKVIVKSIYEDRCLGRENNFFNRFREKVVHNAIESGNPSIAAEVLDSDYLKAIRETEELYNPFDRKFIGLYIKGLTELEKPKLVAFSSFDSLLNIESPDALPSVRVYDLHVVNNGQLREGTDDERLNLIRLFYNFLLQSIEDEVSKSTDDTVIDFHTLAYDSYTWGVIRERGYEVANGSEKDDFMRFTKTILGKGLQDEGNITR